MSEPVIRPQPSPVTIDEVISWFPKTLPQVQNPTLINDLTAKIELTRQWLEATDNSGDPDLTQASRQLPNVSKAAKALKVEITLLLKVGGSYVDTNPRVQALLNEVDLFLAEAPGRPNGPPPKEWNEAASRWAPLVAECLCRPGASPPKSLNPEGPICTVLAKAVGRVYGLEIDPTGISKALGRRRVEQKT